MNTVLQVAWGADSGVKVPTKDILTVPYFNSLWNVNPVLTSNLIFRPTWELDPYRVNITSTSRTLFNVPLGYVVKDPNIALAVTSVAGKKGDVVLYSEDIIEKNDYALLIDSTWSI